LPEDKRYINPLTERLGLTLPIVQAPMAGGATTPELIAAVSRAGGLGSLGAGYMSGPAIRQACEKIRALTDRPFAVSLFAPSDRDRKASDEELRAASAALDGYREELGLTPSPNRLGYEAPWREQLDAVVAARPAVFSFCFGIPEDEDLDRLRAAGCMLIGTATTVAEARLLAKAGVDAVVAQGFEAGGHRGTFSVPFDQGLVGLMALLPQVVDAVEMPVIAAGGIMHGRGIAASLVLGAAAAQMGTAFLTVDESGFGEVQKRALSATREDGTALTKAYTGKPVRGLRNRFMQDAYDKKMPVAPYPAQHGLTSDLRRAAVAQGRRDLMAVWAGQGVPGVRRLSTSELMKRLEAETTAALAGAGRDIGVWSA